MALVSTRPYAILPRGRTCMSVIWAIIMGKLLSKIVIPTGASRSEAQWRDLFMTSSNT
jgi:hypothetical protein